MTPVVRDTMEWRNFLGKGLTCRAEKGLTCRAGALRAEKEFLGKRIDLSCEGLVESNVPFVLAQSKQRSVFSVPKKC